MSTFLDIENPATCVPEADLEDSQMHSDLGLEDEDGDYDFDAGTLELVDDDSEAPDGDPWEVVGIELDTPASRTQTVDDPPGVGGEHPDATEPGGLLQIDHVGAERYKRVLNELYHMFEQFNRELFNEEIGTPVISIQVGKRGPKQTCWCSEQQVWRRTEENLPAYYEISFNGEFLDRHISEIAVDMLHQMVHIWNAQLGIKDNSRNGTYHNNEFKAAAESHGLECDVGESKKDGYSQIFIPSDIMDKLPDWVDAGAFTIKRETIEPPKREKKKPKPPTPLEDFTQKLEDVIKQEFELLEDANEMDVATLAAMLSRKIAKEQEALKTGRPISSDDEQTDNLEDMPLSPRRQYNFDITDGDENELVGADRTSWDNEPDDDEDEELSETALMAKVGLVAYHCPDCGDTVYIKYNGATPELTCRLCQKVYEQG